MNIEITEHCESWEKAFEDEREVLLRVFQDDVKVIEHIGSTSIPGLIAKPVIDIFVAVSPFRNIQYYKDKLENRNCRYTPTDIRNRYLFSKYTEENRWTHNLHLVPFDANFFSRNEILFRDYLRGKPELVFEYNDLKKRLVLRNYSSLEEYTKSKTQFVQTVVDLARVEKGLQRQNVWTMEYIKGE